MSRTRLSLAACVVALAGVSADAHAIDRGVSGLWYNRAQTGHGFDLTVVTPTTATVTWYTYNANGHPVWVAGVLTETAPGVLAGSVDYYQGMRFGVFDPSTNASLSWGELRFTFTSCERATVEYDGSLRYSDGSGFGSGTIELEKLAGVMGLTCSDPR